MKKITLEDLFDRRARRPDICTPEEVTFELTYGCNLKCVHCFNPTHQALPRELKTDEIFRILGELRAFAVLGVVFTGGEAMTRPDLYEVLGKAVSLGFVTRLLTNATRLAPESIPRLAASGILGLSISIYGASAETYEKVTRVPGSFSNFSLCLERLAKSGLEVSLRMPVMTLNAHEVAAARDLARSYGFEFQYSLEISPGQDGSLEPLAYRLTPEEKVRVAAALGVYEKRARECRTADSPFLDCECGQGKRFAVSPYGQMNLCVAFPTPAYDLRSGSVREGWDVLTRFREQTQPGASYECPTCDVRSACRQGRNDAWLEKRDPGACLPHFKEWATLEKKAYENRNADRIIST